MPGLPRVLIVDYDPKNVRSLRDLLEETGYQVDTAADGVTAIATMKRTHHDIVLLEAMIPKKHGFEVCQEFKKTPEGKSTPVIIMTAVYKGRKYRSQAMHVHGCDEYVEKPITPEALLEIVKRFVPPGTVAQAIAVGGGTQKGPSSQVSEKLGEVIPFPAGRSSYTLPDVDDMDAEREIMSKLDEILPDTPAFDEQRLGLAPSGSAVEEIGAVDFDMSSPETGGDLFLDDVPPVSPPPESPGKTSKAGYTLHANQAQSKKPPKAMQADDVEKLTRPKKRAGKPQEQEKGRSPMSLSPALVVGLILAVVATLITYFLGRV